MGRKFKLKGNALYCFSETMMLNGGQVYDVDDTMVNIDLTLLEHPDNETIVEWLEEKQEEVVEKVPQKKKNTKKVE